MFAYAAWYQVRICCCNSATNYEGSILFFLYIVHALRMSNQLVNSLFCLNCYASISLFCILNLNSKPCYDPTVKHEK